VRIDSRAAAAGDDPTLRRFAATIRECQSRLEAVEAANRTARWLLGGTTLTLLAMAAIFGWLIWKTLERQVTPAGIEAALQAKMETLGPPLGEKMVEQVLSAMPAYGDLAVERGMRLWPDLSARVATEVESFAVDTEALVRGRSEKALERVAARLSDDLKRDVPRLTPKRVEQLALRLHGVLLSEGAGLGEEVQATIKRERERIAAMLARLPVEEAATEAEVRLQKRFIHHVLLSIDDMVATWPEPDATPSPMDEDLHPSPPQATPESPPGTDPSPAAEALPEEPNPG